jgi:hypothetical protein
MRSAPLSIIRRRGPRILRSRKGATCETLAAAGAASQGGWRRFAAVNIEGRFEIKDLMRHDRNGPAYLVCAIIDPDVGPASSGLAVADDFVEV